MIYDFIIETKEKGMLMKIMEDIYKSMSTLIFDTKDEKIAIVLLNTGDVIIRVRKTPIANGKFVGSLRGKDRSVLTVFSMFFYPLVKQNKIEITNLFTFID